MKSLSLVETAFSLSRNQVQIYFAPTEVVFHTFLVSVFVPTIWHVLHRSTPLLKKNGASLLHSALVQVRLTIDPSGTKNPRATLAVSGSFHNCQPLGAVSPGVPVIDSSRFLEL